MKGYTDYRRLFDAHKDLNAVFVATPDHNHFPAAMRAVAAGAAVYVEKPMTHSIWEARTLTQAVRDRKVASQMGNQGHSDEPWRILCEYIWAGAIGDVTEVHFSTNRPTWPQGVDRPPSKPVPDGLNWDAWIGPAPYRDYHDNLHAFAWRGWLDFGTGALGDMGCHIMDGAVWALRLGEAATIEVEAESSGLNGETYPNWSIVTYRFPARGSMPPVSLKWFDGGKRPPRPADLEPERKEDFDSVFYGSKGTMVAGTYGGGARIIPEAKRQEVPQPEKTIPRSPKGHQGDFLEAARGGPPASSNFDYSGSLTEIVLLGNLALHLGRKITFDVKNMKAVGYPEANGLIHRPYRPGWVL
ncbi:MAG TPA: Gfo/Idh/MocA family oxidoreductase [Phycisphaerae bacterium]|nr:Gfo/Idh/MocA family oxidoreductase [Phycisphaerae bacterium]